MSELIAKIDIDDGERSFDIPTTVVGWDEVVRQIVEHFELRGHEVKVTPCEDNEEEVWG